MYRSGQPLPQRIDLNINLSHGLGDLVASLPVIKHILDNYTQNHSFCFWVPTYFKELCQFCFPSHKNTFFGLDEKDKFQNLPTLTTNVKIPTFLRQHLTDFNSILVADTILSPEEKNYIKPDISKHKYSKSCKDYLSVLKNRKYVIFTTMYTSDTRIFRAKEVNKLTQWCLNHDIYPVFCGKEESKHFEAGGLILKGKILEEIDYSVGLNLINKTSLLDFIKLSNDAFCVVGVDNGLLHLACMTDVLVMGGFTTVKPEHRLPYRHNTMGWNYHAIVPDESLECRFCQSNWTYDILQDFRECHYQDFKCCDQITADKFIKILE